MIDTGPLFRPLHDELIALLEGLRAEQWQRPTVAGRWRVRDVVAHLIDGDVRRVSAQRDGYEGPPPSSPIDSFDDLVAHLDALNAGWVDAFQRASPQMLLALVSLTGRVSADVLAAVDPHVPALYPVAWAGESESLAWMDVGREFTERWHHQQQIRDAVGAPLLLQERWLHPLLRLSVRALPRAYADRRPERTTSVRVVVDGAGGGVWTIAGDGAGWRLHDGARPDPQATVHLTPDQAWRLLYNAIDDRDAAAIRVEGDADLARPLFAARSVMV